jgi:hypothetical protein
MYASLATVRIEPDATVPELLERKLTLPGGGLAQILREVTPPGAAAMQFALWGYDERYVLPLTNPQPPVPDWLRYELEQRLTFRQAPLGHKDVERLVELLAPASRADWLPAYDPFTWRVDDGPSEAGPRGQWTRCIAAAVASDLGRHRLRELSASVLGLGDVEAHRAKKLRHAYRRRGRRLLHLLGAWPWTHAESGKLPRAWRADERFLQPLESFLQRAWEDGERPVDGSAGGESPPSVFPAVAAARLRFRL